MNDSEIDVIARAIKDATDAFQSPVMFYIAPEAKHRWETNNPDGDWYGQSHDDLESYRIIARAVATALENADGG